MGTIVQPGGVKVFIPDATDDKPPKPEEKAKTASEESALLIKAVRERMEVDAAGDLAAKFSGARQQSNVPPTDQQLNSIVTGLAKNLMETQQSALIAAQSARTDAEKNYFTLMSKFMEGAQANLSRGNVPPDPLSSLKAMMDLSDTINNKALEIANKYPQPPAADPNANSARTEEIRSQNTLALKQMDHIHELAMKELEFKMIQMQTELAKWSRGEQNKSQAWNDALGGILSAFQHGVKESTAGGIGGQQAPPQPSPQSQNVETVQCDGCQNQFSIYRSAPVFSCPACSKIFDRRQPAAPSPESQAATPQPQMSVTDEQGKGNE